MLALQGITIIDLTVAPPGAYSTMILGDLGAEVLKIEPPSSARVGFPAERTSITNGTVDRETAFSALNRNKKSIGLNLKTEEGRRIFYRMTERADVIVEGFRPGVVKRLRLDYETLVGSNPGLVYCSLSGYGQDGPYRDLPGHDINYISVGGALGLIGGRRGPPTIPLNLVADFAGGSLFAVIGVLTALRARERTGRGQHVDVSMTDAVVSLLTYEASMHFREGKIPQRGSTALSGEYPYYGVYETKDGKYISIGCLESWFWENLCGVMGREDFIPYTFERQHLLDEPHGEKWTEITDFLKATFRTRTRDEWFDLLSVADVPVSKVSALDEVFSDPQVLHRGMLEEMESPNAGKIRHVGIPVKLSQTPGRVRSLPPSAGENTEKILKELGYDDELIKDFYNAGVVR